MPEYQIGIVFDLKDHLRIADPTGTLGDVDKLLLTEEIIKHLTLDIETPEQAELATDDMTYLVEALCNKENGKHYVLFYDKPYEKIHHVLNRLCCMFLQMLNDVDFYKRVAKIGYPPIAVEKISRHAYMITVEKK